MIAAVTVDVIVVYCQGPGEGIATADRYGRCNAPGPAIQKGAVWAWVCPHGHMNGSAPSRLGEMPTPVEVLARR